VWYLAPVAACKLLHVYVVLSWAQLMLLCVPADAAEPHVHHPPVGLLLCLCLVSMLCDTTSPTAAAAAVLLGCIFHLHKCHGSE
jgi:hypothetical protein